MWQEFDFKRSGTHTCTHTCVERLAAAGLVSSSQSRSSCLRDNDHTCVQVCGEAHVGLGGVEGGWGGGGVRVCCQLQ